MLKSFERIQEIRGIKIFCIFLGGAVKHMVLLIAHVQRVIKHEAFFKQLGNTDIYNVFLETPINKTLLVVLNRPCKNKQ